MDLNYVSTKRGFSLIFIVVAVGLALLLVFSGGDLSAAIRNTTRVSVGTGGVPSDGSSYFISMSGNGNVVTFESFSTIWAPDQTQNNFVDIFVHDRTTNSTQKLTIGYNGKPSDERSFDPFISNGGRYISFNSYATNLVPGDTNRIPYVDNGLDVFLFDRVTGVLERVSVDWGGGQIEGINRGQVTADSNYIIFSSAGRNVLQNEPNDTGIAFIYLRNWRTGEIERVTTGLNNSLPNGAMGSFSASFDGRYIAYSSQATNLVAGDVNGQGDVFLYDRVTKQTTLISRAHDGGLSNGYSHPAHISPDGRFITYRSFATNLVNPPTDGQSHIFLYDRVTGKTELISVNSDEQLANNFSKEPSVCNGGRYVSFTSDATNLSPLPHNGQRQIYIRDRFRGETFLVTQAISGGMSNGRAHRSMLLPDCSAIGLATEASDMISGDINGVRDLFITYIYYPADLSTSRLVHTAPVASGEVVTYTVKMINRGTDPVVATGAVPLPPRTTYQTGSATNGAVYQAADQRLDWSGTVPGEGSTSFSFAIALDSGLTDPTLINVKAFISGDGTVHEISGPLMLNGLQLYLPIVRQ